MFEDYLIIEFRSIPMEIYIMMQFLDFSYHKKSRSYLNDVDEDIRERVIKFRSNKIIYRDFVDTFKLIFDV